MTRRYAPDIPFPPYAFVPGEQPHPVSHPSGHAFGKSRPDPKPLVLDRPLDSADFLYAVDLFNAGYYWEAHEAWEALWIAAGRRGELADFLKGLIKLAAAGVKIREGQPAGFYRHCRRSLELLESVRCSTAGESDHYCGLPLNDLIQRVRELGEAPIAEDSPVAKNPQAIPIQLVLTRLDHPS